MRRGAAVSIVASGALVAGVLTATAPATAAVHPATALRVTTTSLPTATGGTVYSAKLAATGGIRPYTWSITRGSLPAGLTLVPTTGLITGRSTAGGTSDFTVAVTDSENPTVTATAPESITVNVPQLLVTTTSLPQATAGVPYSAKLAATGGIKPYTWSVSSGSLPAGLKLAAATGVISGTPKAGGNFSFQVKVTDGESPPAASTGQVSLSVGVAPLVVTTGGTLPTATTGAPYSVHLNAAGGIKPYTWSVASGSLPAGLKLYPGGLISGTPSTGGTATFTVQVADGENPAATATATESLTVAAALTVTTTSLPGGTADQPYSATVTATGGVGPYTWSVSSGSLPAGLSLDPATGAISGTPTGTGTATFTATVTDAGNPPVSASATLTITVTALPLAITTSTLPTATRGAFYSEQLTATGGVTPYAWSISSGSLPAGLSLDPATGIISGTPTGLGDSAFTVQVTDSDSPAATASTSLTITVAAPLVVTTTSLPTAIVGQPYMQALTSAGGITPYTWSISSGSLPAGLSLDPATGIISGTPTGLGTTTFTVQVTDSSAPPMQASTQLTITVAAPLAVTTTSLPRTEVGQPYSVQLSATGGVPPYTWSISSGQLPPGLSLDPATGQISGTPTESGGYPFTVLVTDSESPAQTAQANESIPVAPHLFITGTFPPGEVGENYQGQATAVGGVTPYTYSVSQGILPPGLSLDPFTGAVSGNPQVPGDFPVTIEVTDSNSPAATATVHEDVQIAPPLQIVTTNPPPAQQGAGYAFPMLATGGYPPYIWTANGMPPGLTMTPDGQIVGVPAIPGSFAVTVYVSDTNTPAGMTSALVFITVLPMPLPGLAQRAGQTAAHSMWGRLRG